MPGWCELAQQPEAGEVAGQEPWAEDFLAPLGSAGCCAELPVGASKPHNHPVTWVQPAPVPVPFGGTGA